MLDIAFQLPFPSTGGLASLNLVMVSSPDKLGDSLKQEGHLTIKILPKPNIARVDREFRDNARTYSVGDMLWPHLTPPQSKQVYPVMGGLG